MRNNVKRRRHRRWGYSLDAGARKAGVTPYKFRQLIESMEVRTVPFGKSQRLPDGELKRMLKALEEALDGSIPSRPSSTPPSARGQPRAMRSERDRAPATEDTRRTHTGR